MDNSEQVTESLYFHSSSEYFGYRLGQNSGFQGTQVAPYQWSSSDNQGTLTTTLNGGTGTYSLVFETEKSGQTNYSFSAGGSTTGTFTLNNATHITVPSSLVGKIFQESFINHSGENYSNSIYFKTDTKVLETQEGAVSGLDAVYETSYIYSTVGNVATLSITDGSSTATYKLLFTSETAGYSDFSDSDSTTTAGTFTLSDSTDGYSPGDFVNDQLLISGETYIFKTNNVCTIRSDSGSIDSTYRFIKTGQNTAVLSIPADDAAGPDSIFGTADDVIATKYKLTFSSSSSGTISGGRAGNFSYYPEGTSAPSTKGWMWFDEYPWVYSHVEGGWLYFNPSGSKLMVFSVNDQTWREMTE